MRIVSYRGKWCAVVWIDGKRNRISLGNLDATAENHPTAEREAEDLQRKLNMPAGGLIEDIMPAYLDDITVTDKARLETCWKQTKPHFGHLRPDQVTREVCRGYTKRRRKQGRGDGTIRKDISVIRAACNWWRKDNGAVWDLPEPPPARERWMTRKEFARLLEAAKNTHHLTVFLHLAIATAGRKEAILEMTWPQVRWDQNQIWLGRKPNGKKRATVPMTKTLRTVLEKAKSVALTNHVVEYAGSRVLDIKKAYGRARKDAGLEDVTIHDIRRTAGAWMRMNGVKLEDIQDFLGHTDIRVTQRIYARFSPDYLSEAADALEL